MIRIQPVVYVMSLLVLALSVAMCVPAVADAGAGNPEWRVFTGCALFTLALGGLMLLATRTGRPEIGVREAFLLTTGSWLLLGALSALPFMFLGVRLDYADAFFESMSGLTTTGSTVLVGLDSMPPGILLWRALLQWLGGVGIIVMAIAVLPFLRVGGMQVFRTESSDRSDKFMPRPGQVAAVTGLVYLTLSAMCAFGYDITGMTPFEAITHAMTTLATGGYSTSDASIGKFSHATQWVSVVFMLAGALPFALYVHLARGKLSEVLRESQVHTFLGIVAAAVTGVVAWLVIERQVGIGEALRLAAVNVVSVISTTGYATADYNQWGGIVIPIFFFVTFIGGCSGSTAGGLKVFRLEIMYLMARRQLQRLRYPHAVTRDWYNGRDIGQDVPVAVLAFFAVFMATFCAITLAVSATGLDLVTSASATITCMSNVGPGLGTIVGPAGNFASLPDAAKWFLSAAMLLGRLELFTVLVLFSPQFWR